MKDVVGYLKQTLSQMKKFVREAKSKFKVQMQYGCWKALHALRYGYPRDEAS